MSERVAVQFWKFGMVVLIRSLRGALWVSLAGTCMISPKITARIVGAGLEKHMASKTLYVGNLPYSATEADLLSHFSRFGSTKARIIEGRGFGFIDIEADQLEEAIEATHNAEMGGRKLTVNEARPRAEGGGRNFNSSPDRGTFGTEERGGYVEERGGFGGDRNDRGGRGGRSRGGRGGNNGGTSPRW